MATTNPLGRLFGKNPFTALQVHMRVVDRCASEVPGLFEALAAGDQTNVIKIKDRIFAIEEECLEQGLDHGVLPPEPIRVTDQPV